MNFLTSQGVGLHTFSEMPGYRARSVRPRTMPKRVADETVGMISTSQVSGLETWPLLKLSMSLNVKPFGHFGS